MATENGKKSALPRDLTPQSLLVIAEYCGDQIALAIWKHYGGTHLSVPSTVTEQHHLAQNLGLDHAQRFCEQFSGELFCIPNCKRLQEAARNAVIREQRKQGCLLSVLARENKLTDRQIQNICAVQETVSVQVDLFTEL